MTVLEQTLRVSDLLIGMASVVAGLVLFLTNNTEPGIPLMEDDHSIISHFVFKAIIKRILPLLFVLAGVYMLTKRFRECDPVILSLLSLPIVESPAVQSRQSVPRRKILPTKCPRPTLPTGPIHVLAMTEEPLASPKVPRPLKSRSRKKSQRSLPSRSGSDRDISFATTMCANDLTPMAASCESLSPIAYVADASVVPDAIAAIWSTVPSQRDHIW